MISATGSGKSGAPRKGSRFSCPLRGSGRKIPAGNRPQEPQKGGKQAEGLPGGEIPGGTSEG